MRFVPVLLALLLAKDDKGVSPCRRLRPSPDPELQKFLARYEFTDKEFSWELHLVREGEKTAQYWLRFPSALPGDIEENKTVWARFWRPKDERKRRPAAVLLHWLAGSFDALDLIGRRLAEQGIAALMVYLPHYGPRRSKEAGRRRSLLDLDVGTSVASMRQAMLDVRRAGDWLAARPDVEPSRIGIVGVSMGAVIGSLVAGVDDRFGPSVFILGGADLAAIVFHGSKETAELKAKFEAAGWTQEKLREALREIEPLTFAGRMRRDEILMISAEADDVIPKACTERLHEAIGRPEIKWYKGGHYAVVFQVGMILRDTAAHLAKERSYATLPDPLMGVPRIRILVGEALERARIEVAGAWEARPVGGGTPARGRRLACSIGETGGRLALGPHTFESRRVMLRSLEDSEIRLDARAYRGTLEFSSSGKGTFHAIHEVDLESYVAGVVGPEIGAEAPLEAQKAQAVAARTFAWMDLAREGPFHVYADRRSQVYGGTPAPGSLPGRAARETAGQLLVYEGKPFKTWYSACCGGSTASVAEALGANEIPPLAGVPCAACEGSRHFSWTETFAEADFKTGPFESVAVSGITRSGRVRDVVFTLADGSRKTLSSAEVRAMVGPDRLRSTRFNLSYQDKNVRVTGRGWGHGCGLCQEGALGMARRGRSYREILEKYYPCAALRRLYDP